MTREMLAAMFGEVFPHLDERQRRLLMGAGARALGHGGIRRWPRRPGPGRRVAGCGGAGVREAAPGPGPAPGRGPQGWPRSDPGLVPALLALVEPMSGATRSRRCAGPLSRLARWPASWPPRGIRSPADTVHKLLREQGFSLQANAKTIEGRQHPDRDGQFRYINEQAHAHRGRRPGGQRGRQEERAGRAVRQPGRGWRPRGDPVRVRDHDFPDREQQKAIPYGIYDLAANTGWVNVGTDRNTAEFAVESIRRWWKDRGSARYPAARRLLITATPAGPTGTGPGPGRRAWPRWRPRPGWRSPAATSRPARPSGTRSSTGCSPPLTMNWRGRPLASHEVIVNTIAATTRTGLTVTAVLDAPCPTGAGISDAQMKDLEDRA